MKKVFISQPMAGLTDEEIKKKRIGEEYLIQEYLKGPAYNIEDVEIIDSFFEDASKEDIKNRPIWYLAKSIELLADADVAYFLEGWQKARGCVIEHEVAVRYGLEIIYE